jgi:hypothetical protein
MLLAAVFWSVAVIIFKSVGNRVSPFVITPAKNVIAIFIFGLSSVKYTSTKYKGKCVPKDTICDSSGQPPKHKSYILEGKIYQISVNIGQTAVHYMKIIRCLEEAGMILIRR